MFVKTVLKPDDARRFADKLKRYEGARRNAKGEHSAYRCPAGALTIGYGHNLDANPVPGLNARSTLTEEQACRLLGADVLRTEGDMQRALPFVRGLDAVRYATLLDMAFNMGVPALRKFKKTLEFVKAGQYAQAAENMLKSRWARQVGYRAVENAEQMRTGQWV